jgi:hypothetical protein
MDDTMEGAEVLPEEPRKASWVVDWDDVRDLGRVPDGRLARRLGVTPAAVRNARLVRGIPAHEKRTARTGAHPGTWVKVDPLLGTMPDTELARRFGVRVGMVRSRRARLGIPVWCAR